MKKKLIIRADASIEIGTGHIMRCIALAQGWQDRGGEVLFISHCESDTLRERILKEGFRFISLNRTCPDVSDLEDTLDIIEGEKNGQRDWVVLDGYHFTPEYQQAIRNSGHRLFVIDDMNHLPFYHADILLNQNLHALDLKYCSDSDTTLLLGSRYVLLRREFLEYKKFRRRIPDKARKILVTMGGSDPGNVTLMVIDALRNLNDSEIEIKVVIGPANPHRETLSKALTGANFPEELIVNPSNMPELMTWADMAITAGGSTCWELAFMGVPIMVLILADNQEALAEGISKRGFGVNLGWYKTFDKNAIIREMNALIQSKDRRFNMVRTGRTLINTGANDNLYKNMCAPSISIKPIKEDDCEMIWKWANDKDVRNSAFSSASISYEDHKKWFQAKLNDPRSYQFIGYDRCNRPIGQIRFDEVCINEYEVDLSIDKQLRNYGFGTALIEKTISELKRQTCVDTVHAYVKVTNGPSKHAFLKANFILDEYKIVNDTQCFHLVWKKE